MTTLKEVIDAFRMKANTHWNPSMDGRRDAEMMGRMTAYLDCANILENVIENINKELDDIAKEKYPEKNEFDYERSKYMDGWVDVNAESRNAFKEGCHKIIE